MSWLLRLLGMGEPEMPPHVRKALDTAAKADESIAAGHAAVLDLAAARKGDQDKVVADYLAAEQDRTRR